MSKACWTNWKTNGGTTKESAAAGEVIPRSAPSEQKWWVTQCNSPPPKKVSSKPAQGLPPRPHPTPTPNPHLTAWPVTLLSQQVSATWITSTCTLVSWRPGSSRWKCTNSVVFRPVPVGSLCPDTSVALAAYFRRYVNAHLALQNSLLLRPNGASTSIATATGKRRERNVRKRIKDRKKREKETKKKKV